jgi:folate-binding protein YgfZ
LTALDLSDPFLRAAVESAAVVADPARETLVISGRDARSWLNGLVTHDLTPLDARRGGYGLLLTKQGKIQTDLDVILGASGLVLSVAPGAAETIRSVLDRYLVMEDAEITVQPDLAWLRLIGPRAAEVLEPLAALSAVRGVGAIDWLGLGGAEAVARAGADAVQATLAEWDGLRISRGFPRILRDYGGEDNPHEAALDKLAVSFSKGCYLGQEVVCMQDMRGRVKRRLIPLELTHTATADVGSEVRVAGTAEAVGQITSIARAGSAVVALARVRAPFFEDGTALEVGGASVTRITNASL